MSGIAVILRRDGGLAAREQIEGMLDAMAHRGPDGRGAWTDGALAVGHLLLASDDDAASEPQPAVVGEHCLLADCRIDSRDAILRDLGDAGRARVPSDAGAVLRAYERWGEGCIERLLGDFAFAIWDRRHWTLVPRPAEAGHPPVGIHVSGDGRRVKGGRRWPPWSARRGWCRAMAFAPSGFAAADRGGSRAAAVGPGRPGERP